MKFKFIITVAAVLALTIAPLFAAAASFTLRGRVLDPSRAAIAGARVAAVPQGAGETATAQTSGNGEFTLALAPGSYTVTVAAAGFGEARQELAAGAGDTASLEFAMKVATFGESVTVRAPGDYDVDVITSGTKTPTPLRDVPQSVTVTTRELIHDQMMLSIGDVMRYTPGIQVHQGENNRDQVIIRGNSSSADFFLNGVRDDVQYYRDLYNLDRVEALKGPNAMIFGRGGGGGVVNRVTKEALFRPMREVTLQAGEFGHKRVSADFDEPLNDKFALRFNTMYENSDSFRDGVDLQRYAFNPTLTFAASPATRLTVSYEHLHDTRVADRGITSFAGRPADVDVSTFYGNPADSHVRADVELVSATAEHKAGNLTLRNRTTYGNYDRFYQNYVPGVVSADKATVTLTAYNNATQRANLFSQTDLIYTAETGSLKHTLLAGFELGNQNTDNFRNTGFFNDTATSLLLPYSNPTTTVPVTFRQGLTDADNHLDTTVAAVYVQDQLELSPSFQVLGGVRFDRFDLTYHNNRNGDVIGRDDNLVSPRAGIVYKPVEEVSVYGSYAVSYLPSSGDQFSSLTTITEQVKPEKFNNYEVGAKWEPVSGLSVTTALYRLNRENTRALDPNDPTRIVQTGSQRTNGYELGIAGRLTSAWRVAGGYAYQDAFVTSATATAREGAQVAQVPHHTLSLWNHYQVMPRLGAAVGVLYRTDMFATIDNTVTLPGHTRVDLAAFYTLKRDIRLQANLENVFDKAYWINADSNTNISPGFGRTLRVGITAGF
jgi:catecholate siderophore receptor